MRIFISWSGQESLAVASAVQAWLKLVIPSPDIFLSSESLDPGVRWGGQLGQSLQETNYGIICLTPTNLESPWVLFEAGAISKVVEDSHVTPLLHRVSKTNVSGPLAMFQMIEATKRDFKGLAESINQQSEVPKDKITLDRILDLAWPDLERDLLAIPSEEGEVQERQRPERELMEEILALVRGMTSSDRREARIWAQEERDQDSRLQHRWWLIDPSKASRSERIRTFNEWLETHVDTPFELHAGSSSRKVIVYFGPDPLPTPLMQNRILKMGDEMGFLVQLKNDDSGLGPGV